MQMPIADKRGEKICMSIIKKARIKYEKKWTDICSSSGWKPKKYFKNPIDWFFLKFGTIMSGK